MSLSLVQISMSRESDFAFQSPMSRICLDRPGVVHRPASKRTAPKATGTKPSAPPKREYHHEKDDREGEINQRCCEAAAKQLAPHLQLPEARKLGGKRRVFAHAERQAEDCPKGSGCRQCVKARAKPRYGRRTMVTQPQLHSNRRQSADEEEGQRVDAISRQSPCRRHT